MKNLSMILAIVPLMVACRAPKDGSSVTNAGTSATTPSPDSSSMNSSSAKARAQTAAPAVLDTFVNHGGNVAFDSRRDVDVTGDGKQDIVAVHASGPHADSMTVRLSILSAAGDTLFATGWSTRLYFIYVPRSKFTAAAADSLVLGHLKSLTADKAFTPSGPPLRMRKANARTGGIDRDAVRYDIKEQGVRALQGIPRSTPLSGAALDAQEKFVVSDASIDSLVTELKNQPTFTYFAGGEVTNTIAWSNVKQRFVRIFSCC